MEDVNLWQVKFEWCHYSKRLIDKLFSLNTIVDNPVDINEIKKAIYYARKYHGSQKRQSGEPYYSHPLEVAYMLAEYSVEENPKHFRTDLLVTAILHDTIEDTNLTFEMIKFIFGDKVANQVMDLSRNKDDNNKITSSEMLRLLWKQKKYDLLLVKQIDRLHNIQTIHAKSAEKMREIANETLESFVAFAMHTQHKSLEKAIYRLCCEALSLKSIPYELSQIKEHETHLSCLEDTDTHQFVSQVFQNATRRTKNIR